MWLMALPVLQHAWLPLCLLPTPLTLPFLFPAFSVWLSHVYFLCGIISLPLIFNSLITKCLFGYLWALNLDAHTFLNIRFLKILFKWISFFMQFFFYFPITAIVLLFIQFMVFYVELVFLPYFFLFFPFFCLLLSLPRH